MPKKKPSRASVLSTQRPAAPDVSTRQTLPRAAGRMTAGERQKAFARECFASSNATQAYYRVYDPDKRSSRTSTARKATALRKHPAVVAELQRLEKLHAEEIAAEQAKHAEAVKAAEAAAIATRSEVQKFLTRVMRCPSSSFDQTTKDLCHVVETKRLAPQKFDKDGEPIPHPDADEEGYVTDVTRRPPDLPTRIKAAEELSKLNGWQKPDPNAGKVADALTDLLISVRGGGRT